MDATIKKMATKRLPKTAFALLLLLALGSYASAQVPEIIESNADEELTANFDELGPDETGACFQYYKFQSVAIDVRTDKENYDEGETITLSGTITNKNAYPLVGGVLRVRMVKSSADNVQGPDIIDEFVAVENIALRDREVQNVSFTYALPPRMQEGRHQAFFYFDIAHKFNLAGLPFTDDIYGGTISFNVFGQESGITFDRSKILVNNTPHNLIGFIRNVEADTFTISLPIKNETKSEKTIRVMYDLYQWSAQESKNLLKSESELVTLTGGERRTLRYLINPVSPVHYLRVRAQTDDGEKAAVFIRLGSSGFKPRINFAGISEFPLSSNKSVALFGCFHNTTAMAGEGRFELALQDPQGNILASKSRQTIIAGGMLFLKEEFLPKTAYSAIILLARLYGKDGALHDELTLSFDCRTYPLLCQDQGATGWRMSTASIVAILLISLAIIMLFLRVKKKLVQ